MAQNALLLVGWHLSIVGYPSGGFALGLFALAVVFAAETVVVQHRWRGVVVEKPLGARAAAGHALELGAVPMAELLGVSVIRVGAHQAVDAEETDSGKKFLVVAVSHFVRVAQFLALAAVDGIGWVAVDNYPAEVGPL